MTKEEEMGWQGGVQRLSMFAVPIMIVCIFATIGLDRYARLRIEMQDVEILELKNRIYLIEKDEFKKITLREDLNEILKITMDNH